MGSLKCAVVTHPSTTGGKTLAPGQMQERRDAASRLWSKTGCLGSAVICSTVLVSLRRQLSEG